MTQLDNRKEPSQGHVGGSEAQEREAFEAFVRQELGDVAVMDQDRYISPKVQKYWLTWQAARATAAAPAAPSAVPTDAELTAIYKRANGEDTGKAKPLTTANIFRAMRAMLTDAQHKTWYEAAMVASNEAGCVGMDAAETIRYLSANAAAHPPAAVGQALEALRLAKTGLAWYRDRCPDAMDGSDDEADEQIDAAIAALSVQAGEVPAVVDAPELSDAAIDAIAEGMPGGMDGFLHGWGWRQFAHKVLEGQAYVWSQDAERYRWLRNESAPTLDPADNGKPWCARVSGAGLKAYNEPLYGELLDEAIDAAMRAADTKEGN